jgi:hypothetical protein
MANINFKEHECDIAYAAQLLEFYTDVNDAVMLWGAPGIGKSDAVKQLAAKKRRKVIDLRLNIREPVDLRGIPVPDLATGTTRWLVPDELPQVERDGETGYLFLDEINTSSPQMMAVAMQLVLDRKVGDYILPDGWVIVAAGNRIGDRASAQRMPTALRSRFAHITIVADVKAWADWATANNLRPELVAFIRLRGQDVLHVMPRGDENAFPTPRSWAKCSKYIDAPKALRLRLLAGHVGDAYAAELDAFIHLYQSIGDLQDIVKNPATANVPTEPSVRFAVCTALGRMADKKTFPAIVQYAERLPRQSQILVVHDATLRDAALKNTATYGKWAVANQDLVIQ